MTEITQVTSPNTYLGSFVNETGEIASKKQSGYMVTCNLSSLVLDRIYTYAPEDFYKTLQEVVKIQMLALDNVIDVGTIPVAEAAWTNKQFRNVGAGEMGFAALLALKRIQWDGPAAPLFTEELESNILRYTILASSELARERGSYPLYPGSDWETGMFFTKRGLDTPEWKEVQLAVRMHGIRNGQLRAPAPNASSATICGSTPASENIFDVMYSQKKKDGNIPIVVPHLSEETWFYYRPIIRLKPFDGQEDLKFLWAQKLNAIRQKYVDQAISFNTYVMDNISGGNVLKIHLENWRSGVKTSYYFDTKNKATESSCLACEA